MPQTNRKVQIGDFVAWPSLIKDYYAKVVDVRIEDKDTEVKIDGLYKDQWFSLGLFEILTESDRLKARLLGVNQQRT